MYKVTSIRLCGFHNYNDTKFKIDDSAVTYVFGPNGSGKSSILQGIQFALLGYIPGTNKQNSAIFLHSNNTRYMSVELELLNTDSNTTVTISRSLDKVGNTIQSSVQVTPSNYTVEEIVSDQSWYPILHMSEFMNLSPNKLKDWLLDFLPKAECTVDWNAELENGLDSTVVKTDRIEDLKKEIISEIQKLNLSGVEEIRNANTIMKAYASATNTSIKRAEDTVKSLIYYDDFDTTETKESATNKIAELQAKIEMVNKYKMAVEFNRKIEEELRLINESERTDELQGWKLKEEECEAEYLSVAAELAQLTDKKSELSAKLVVISDTSGICPYSKQKCDTAVAAIEQMKQDVQTATNNLKSVNDKIAELTAKLSSLDEERNRATANICAIERQNARKTELMRQKVDVPDCIESEEDLRNELSRMQDIYTKITANERYQNLTQTMIQSKFDFENQLKALKLWDKLTSVNGLQSTLAGSNPIANLTDNMSEFVSIFWNDSRVVSFGTEKSNSFSIGIERCGVYVPYNQLSSGEKCIFALALFVELMKVSSSKLKVIMVDDMLDHLDKDRFIQLMDHITANNDFQFIFAGVSPLARNSQVHLVDLTPNI